MEKGIAVISLCKCFGGMSFFLSLPRVATAVEHDDVDLVTSINDYICILMNEFFE